MKTNDVKTIVLLVHGETVEELLNNFNTTIEDVKKEFENRKEIGTIDDNWIDGYSDVDMFDEEIKSLYDYIKKIDPNFDSD
jgi:predicted RNase H-like nuclease (RuvC/YqgF family)